MTIRRRRRLLTGSLETSTASLATSTRPSTAWSIDLISQGGGDSNGNDDVGSNDDDDDNQLHDCDGGCNKKDKHDDLLKSETPSSDRSDIGVQLFKLT